MLVLRSINSLSLTGGGMGGGGTEAWAMVVQPTKRGKTTTLHECALVPRRAFFKAHRLVYHSTLGFRVIKASLSATRGQLQGFSGPLPESSGQDLALTVLYVPSSLDSGCACEMGIGGLELRVQGSGFRVQGSGFRVEG